MYFKIMRPSDQLVYTYKKEQIKNLYLNKDVQESLESKVLRLKMLENLIAQELWINCGGNKKCQDQIEKVTKTPGLIR